MLHIFTTTFDKDTSRGLLLYIKMRCLGDNGFSQKSTSRSSEGIFFKYKQSRTPHKLFQFLITHDIHIHYECKLFFNNAKPPNRKIHPNVFILYGRIAVLQRNVKNVESSFFFMSA